MTTRIFLGFAKPALHSAVEYLADRYRRGNMLAMDGVTIVLPTGRSGRRLQSLLAEHSQVNRLGFVPPQIVTVSHVPELLYTARLPFASVQSQQFAWATALRKVTHLHTSLVPVSTQPNRPWGNRQWLDAGRVFWRMYRELAAEGLSFADVAKVAQAWQNCPDVNRWMDLAQLQETYWSLLRELQLWDQQSARLIAVRSHECRTARDLVLVGTADLNKTLQAMLHQVGDHVTALVHAPSEWQDRFDTMGVLKAEAWEEVDIPLDDSQWTVADNPESQAEAGVDWLAGVSEDYRMDEIVVGCPDAGLAPYVQRQLAERNVPSRWAAGQSMSESPAFLLLACIRNWVRSRHREDFAQLARHPDITRWLSRKHIDADWLTDLDRYHEDHLSRTYGTWWADQPNTYRIRKPFDLIENWLQDLFGPSRSMAEWMMRLRSVLREVYAKHFLNREDSVEHHALTACQIVAKEIDQLANVPAPLATTMTADEAIELVMAGIEKKVLTPHASAECVEILGWLELPLDDSRVMVVGGIHEGTVPRAVTSDQFLPNQLRERLGIDDARDRYARDAYAISTLLSGNRIVHFVVGRSTVEGDPLRPSRLLLATRGDELVRRWQKLLRPGPTENSPNGSLCASSVFQIPRPNKAIPIPQRMTVSGFKAYLQCPYRFYLSHILKLKEVDDSSREMNPRLFGTLIHRVLDDFGRGPAQNSVNASEIAEYCRHALRHQAALQFGDLALPPVQIQLWQIQNLLEEFAETQAEWAAKGWRIKHIEDRLVCTFIVDGTTMEIEGRIDRIDHNDKTGQWAVLDYKTSKEAKKPAQSHRKKDGTWLDLQLPLYRHLAATKAISRPNVGYFSLPVSGKCAISCLDWTEHDFTEADKKVEEVVRNIRKRCFWPPSPTRYADEWADICMVGLLERPDL